MGRIPLRRRPRPLRVALTPVAHAAPAQGTVITAGIALEHPRPIRDDSERLARDPLAPGREGEADGDSSSSVGPLNTVSPGTSSAPC